MKNEKSINISLSISRSHSQEEFNQMARRWQEQQTVRDMYHHFLLRKGDKVEHDRALHSHGRVRHEQLTFSHNPGTLGYDMHLVRWKFESQ